MYRFLEKLPLLIIGLCVIGLGVVLFRSALPLQGPDLIPKIGVTILAAIVVFFGLYIEIETIKSPY